MSDPTTLLSRVSLGNGLDLANRVVMAPMTRGRSGLSRVPNALNGSYYVQRSSAGLMISEGVTISPQAEGWNGNPGIYTDAMIAGWRSVLDRVHSAGGVMFCQLWHCGRASHSLFHQGERPVAPSSVLMNQDGIHTPEGKRPLEIPRELSIDEIPGIVDDFRAAAAAASEAGFDGVEIHAANGYLIDGFLQSRTNHRTDHYGGTVEKRFRFLGEIVDAVTSEWPSNRVGVRLSPNGNYNDMGSVDFREQFCFAAAELNARDLAYLHVVDGLAFGFHELGEPIQLAEVREHYRGTIIANCGYTQASADRAIVEGDADLVSFGRPFISNPDLVERFALGLPLADPAAPSTWFEDHGRAGYTDFPLAGREVARPRQRAMPTRSTASESATEPAGADHDHQ